MILYPNNQYDNVCTYDSMSPVLYHDVCCKGKQKESFPKIIHINLWEGVVY